MQLVKVIHSKLVKTNIFVLLFIPLLEFNVISDKRNRCPENRHFVSLYLTLFGHIINGVDILPSGQVVDTERNRAMRQ